MNEQTQDWVRKIKQHAALHYEENGWDFVVETMSDDEIAEILKEDLRDGKAATTYAEALDAVQQVVSLLDERRRSVRAEIF